LRNLPSQGHAQLIARKFLIYKEIHSMSTLQNAVTTSSAPPTATESTFSRPEAIPPWRNPTQFERPSYLLSFPFSFSTEFANNPWMQDLPGDRRLPNFKRGQYPIFGVVSLSLRRGVDLRSAYSANRPAAGLVFTANLGVVLDHMADKNIAIISNFTSEPRRGENAGGASSSSSRWATRSGSRQRSLRAKPNLSISMATFTSAATAFAPNVNL